MAEAWKSLEEQAAEIASFGKLRIDGKVAYLATVQDACPRVHPVTPIVGDGRCYIFAEPDSSKVRHLRESGRFSLHCGMSDSSGSSGEFKIVGSAVEISDDSVRAHAESICSFRPSSRSLLFELCLEEAVATSYRGGRPDRRRWVASN